MSDHAITLGGVTVKPGRRTTVDLPLPPLYTHTSVSMPVTVINGRNPGPVLFLSAAIHGDEINGVEIIRRLLDSRAMSRLSGTVLSVPVVNVFGFVTRSRYLPDRRDLNRSFPGYESGSMAARLAHVFCNEVMFRCTHGIDFHTAAAGRDNLPQIRADLEGQESLRGMAEAFAPPIILDSEARQGTLRDAAGDKVALLLYEAGEALRFDEVAIRVGVQGSLRVMRHLGMLPPARKQDRPYKPYVAKDSSWMRAPQSGILRTRLKLGSLVSEGELLGVVADPVGEVEQRIESSVSGVLVGRTNMPLVHEGEALFHVANTTSMTRAARTMDEYHELYDDPLFISRH